jgi:eukaryotic-like serine/threonine-protein kinase
MSDSAVGIEPRLIGETIAGRYLVEVLLGGNARRAVYRARDSQQPRVVAISVLLSHRFRDTLERARFEQVARTLAALEHPNIARTVDHGVIGQSGYLVTEWLDGESLATRLRQGSPASDAAISIVRQLLAALAAAHGSGLVHGQLAPGSVFLQRSLHAGERVKLLDFALPEPNQAARFGNGASLVQPAVGGERAAASLASQQARTALAHSGPRDPRSDVYAAGALLSELLVGAPPRDAALSGVSLRPSSSSAPPIANLALRAVVETAMSTQPRDRYANAAEMLSALVDALPRVVHSAPVERPKAPRAPAIASAVNERVVHAAGPATRAPSAPNGPSVVPPAAARVHASDWTLASVLQPSAASMWLMLIALVAVVAWLRSDVGRSRVSHLPNRSLGAPSVSLSDPLPPPSAASNAEPTETDVRAALAAPEPPPPQASLPTPAAAALPTLATPPQPARARQLLAGNPWLDPLPPALQDIKASLAVGAIDDVPLRTLREYNATQPGDPRGHLLLGRLYLNRLWRTDAVSEFAIALRLDPSARGAPELLPMLLQLVAQGKAVDPATTLIAKAYGREALATVESALTSTHNSAAAQRLEALRALLADSK